ncbi:MAG TPA: GldG family protein [Polyangiaceae bacterium]
MKAWSRSLPWVGALAAALLLVNVNVLGARWYQRWDFTSERLYTLSQPTRELLAALRTPVDVVVLLGKADPLALGVRHMLEAYGAQTRQLRVRYVDPDRSPAELLALQQKYQILAGKADDGRVVTDAALIVSQLDERGAERHWFVTAEELVRFDEESGRSRPTLEAALSGALVSVLRPAKAKLCFATGQREPTLEDQGPEGLSELKQRLLKNNFEAESVDSSSPRASYDGCAALLVVTPELEFGADDAQRIAAYVRAGGSAVLLLAPSADEGQLLRPTGLEPVLELAGVRLGRDVVLEHDQAVRLPRGNGEAFFAKLRAHAVTRGVLHEDDKLSSRVLVVQARSLDASGGATLLMTSSDQASAVENLSWLLEPARLDGAVRKSYGLAAARELAKPAGSDRPHGARLFVSGASNLAWNRNFQDPALYGNRRLLENAISWVAARPSMISVPEKEQREVGLSLSDESIDEVLRYVLLYMPASAGLIGAFVLLRRRNLERRSRRAPSES